MTHLEVTNSHPEPYDLTLLEKEHSEKCTTHKQQDYFPSQFVFCKKTQKQLPSQAGATPTAGLERSVGSLNIYLYTEQTDGIFCQPH